MSDDGGAPLTQRDIENMFDEIGKPLQPPRTASEASIREAERDYAEYRMAAAERLARLVVGNFSDVAGAMVMTSWDGQCVLVDGMVAEAKRVLGEEA